jgi:hypothetical protein
MPAAGSAVRVPDEYQPDSLKILAVGARLPTTHGKKTHLARRVGRATRSRTKRMLPAIALVIDLNTRRGLLYREVAENYYVLANID